MVARSAALPRAPDQPGDRDPGDSRFDFQDQIELNSWFHDTRDGLLYAPTGYYIKCIAKGFQRNMHFLYHELTNQHPPNIRSSTPYVRSSTPPCSIHLM